MKLVRPGEDAFRHRVAAGDHEVVAGEIELVDAVRIGTDGAVQDSPALRLSELEQNDSAQPVVARDGTVWYTDQHNSYIGRLDPQNGHRAVGGPRSPARPPSSPQAISRGTRKKPMPFPPTTSTSPMTTTGRSPSPWTPTSTATSWTGNTAR